MSTETSAKTVQDAAHEPVVRTSKQGGLRDSVLGTRNLMTVAALGVVGSLLVVPLSLVGHSAATSPKNVIVLCSLMGAWFIAYALPGVIVRKPGAFMVGGLIMGIISSFATPLGFGALPGNLVGAAFVEFPFLVLLYRKWNWWVYAIGATIFGGLNSTAYTTAMGVAMTPLQATAAVAAAMTSTYIGLAACFGLRRALARTGVGIAK
ncbi:ECF transporter S component [Buchananella felis]|uniref:ECF transporter S component n=1 Tax=Buchananella felis TaxID=3231492 RepID=UPI00352829D3